VYDKVSISLHGAGAQTNFPIDQVSSQFDQSFTNVCPRFDQVLTGM
jgi:hypothetical protein